MLVHPSRAGSRGNRGGRHVLRPSRIAVPSPFACRVPRRAARCMLVAALLLAIPCAHAQSGKPLLSDTYAVTASRGAQPIADVLADVTVIDAATIARSGAQSLTELVQRQPGVEITQNGGPGSLSGIFLRGANRGQTLVLVDGVRLASSSAGATSLEAIPLDQVDRIEILRGPSSSLYGADAIGGVIQVFTRTRHVGADRQCERRRRHVRDVGRQGRRDRHVGTAGVRGARRRRRGATASTPSSIRRAFSTTATRTATRTRACPRHLGYTFAPGQEITGQYLPQPPEQSVRRRPGLRRSHRSPTPRRGRWRCATCWRRSGCRD